MGNTQKETTVPAPARLAALRASAACMTVTTLSAVHRIIMSALGGLISAARALRTGPLGRSLARTILPAATDGVNAVRTAVAPANRAAAGVILPVAAACASTARTAATRVTDALPARTRVPAAAAAALAPAAAVTAILIAIGPAAAMGPAGPAVAAGALRSAGAATAEAAVDKQHAAGAVAAAGLHRKVVAAPGARHVARAVPHAVAHRRVAGGVVVRHAAGPTRRRHRRHHAQAALNSWHAITEAAAGHPHGPLPPAQRLLPAPLAAGQAALPLTPARAANAQLITRQALRLHLGLRSAVIAVATAMQESTLENLAYGDRDSLGLFQQRPSAGWGTPAQITNPRYAADAFLHALAAYQAADPRWATQPLYQAAQGVQRSAFPYAYAQWENQAAHIVTQAARHLL